MRMEIYGDGSGCGCDAPRSVGTGLVTKIARVSSAAASSSKLRRPVQKTMALSPPQLKPLSSLRLPRSSPRQTLKIPRHVEIRPSPRPSRRVSNRVLLADPHRLYPSITTCKLALPSSPVATAMWGRLDPEAGFNDAGIISTATTPSAIGGYTQASPCIDLCVAGFLHITPPPPGCCTNHYGQSLCIRQIRWRMTHSISFLDDSSQYCNPYPEPR